MPVQKSLETYWMHLVLEEIWFISKFFPFLAMSKFSRDRFRLLLLLLLLLFYSFESSSHQRKLIVLHWSLSDNKFPQVSKTLLSILVDLKNAVVWMVSNLHLISKSSSPCTNPLMTVLSASIIIGTIVILLLSWIFLFVFSSSLSIFQSCY